MRFETIKTAVLCGAILAGTAATGCESKTEGERTMDKAKRVENAGDMKLRGEAAIRDGKAMVARGQATKDQGKQVEGASLISEGEALQKKGQADIEAGRKLESGM